MSFGMTANTVTYIWKKLLTAAIELPAVKLLQLKYYGMSWQSNGGIHWLDGPFPTEIEELLVDGDDDLNDDMKYEYGNEVESDNQLDQL